MPLIHYYISRNRESTSAKTMKFLVQILTRFSVHHLGNHLLRGLFNGITSSLQGEGGAAWCEGVFIPICLLDVEDGSVGERKTP